MNNIKAILIKQVKDTMKNKTIFIQFIMFPIFTLIMSNSIKIQEMPENFFVNLFATMYIGMAPLTSMAAIISEEKEKNTLRVLMMSNVKPGEYLLGIGIYVWFVCIIGAAIICAVGKYSIPERLSFMGIIAVGILISLLIGAAIGTCSTTQMMATSITLPVMMIFAFLPMLSLFNETIAKIAKFSYSEQIRLMLAQINNLAIGMETVCIMAVNIVLCLVCFTIAYKKCGYASVTTPGN